MMSNDNTPTPAPQTVAASTLAPELHPYALELLANGYRVRYYPNGGRVSVSWLIFERDGRAGTAELGQYRHLDPGVSVTFPVRPSREYGSGLAVWHHDHPHYKAPGAVTFLDAARIATGETFSNFANPGHPLPNDGPGHFAWAAARLVELVADAEGNR